MTGDTRESQPQPLSRGLVPLEQWLGWHRRGRSRETVLSADA